MSVDNKVDNTREAVKAVLSGDKLGEVSTRFGVDKGTLSKLVKGAQIGQSLMSVAHASVDHEPPPDCETCEKVQALTTQVEELQTGVDHGVCVDHEGDDTPPMSVDHSEELTALTMERDSLQALVDNLEAEKEALTTELTALKESAPAPDEVTPPAGELPGLVLDTVCYPWWAIAELKEWTESMGQKATDILERWATWRVAYQSWQAWRTGYETMRGYVGTLTRAYIKLRLRYEPSWVPPSVKPAKGEEHREAEITGYLLLREIVDEEKKEKTPPEPAPARVEPRQYRPIAWTAPPEPAGDDETPAPPVEPEPRMRTLAEIEAGPEAGDAVAGKPTPGVASEAVPAGTAVKVRRLRSFSEIWASAKGRQRAEVLVNYPLVWVRHRLQHRN